MWKTRNRYRRYQWPQNDCDHINVLQRLEEEYCHLNYMERNINSSLCWLQEEEASLGLAHEQSSTLLQEQRETISKRKEEEAVAQLEEALMMDRDDSNDSMIAR